MIVDVVVQAPMRRWQAKLVAALRAAGHDVRVLVGRPRRGLGLLSILAIAVERWIAGPKPSLFDAVMSKAASGSSQPGRSDLTIALDGEPPDADKVTLVPLFAGLTGDRGLVDMIIGGGTPFLTIVQIRGADRRELVVATLAIEDRRSLSRSLDLVLARAVTLILKGVRSTDAEHLPRAAVGSTGHDATTARGAIVSYIVRSLAQKLLRRRPGAERRPDHWRIGYRFVPDPKAPISPDAGGFIILADDGRRFYADPMLFEHGGARHLFFEDFPYSTGRGVIGHVEIDAEGTASTPRTVLAHACHLSYPFLLEHAGAIYMLPEMSGARRVQLFRADPFPDRWVADRILLDGVVAADATPVLHDGRWWMFAAVSDDGGSSWDQLCLFHAPDLFGPWAAHPENPVLVDAGCARPAGPMWHENGILMRVAQDCRRGYGEALVVCRVDQLDASGFRQSIVKRVEAPPGYGADGVHTLCATRDMEVLDLRFRPSARHRCSATPHAPARD